ncbi:hypothetical protein ABEB36_004556 [Hypothenemus hampei]|uniref:S-phase kinase-associated protein 1 n=1 Tax=Hypothenemus hampei TaxID=57062 RepID=A0ABD1F7F0_HYPHA
MLLLEDFEKNGSNLIHHRKLEDVQTPQASQAEKSECHIRATLLVRNHQSAPPIFLSVGFFRVVGGTELVGSRGSAKISLYETLLKKAVLSNSSKYLGTVRSLKIKISIMPQIKLESSDGEVFPVDVKVAKVSTTLKTMLEDLGMEDDDDETVPLPNVNAAILRKVLEWCKFHQDDPPVTEEEEDEDKRCDNIPDWDREFLNVDQGTLFELISAANYLNIKGLMNVSCKTVANMIRGKTPEEIRKTFNIENDFTPEEEERVRKENDWCED